MLLQIPEVFSKAEVKALRARLDAGPWADGNMTSGHQSATAKKNLQLPEDSEVAKEVSALVVQALNANPMFVAAALPHTIFPPLFNRYEGGGTFGDHIDNAIRFRRGSDFRLRSDLSATLFLSDPDSYDGGGLVIEGFTEAPGIKLPAGHLILYPATTVHRVEPVTRGARVASFFWIQSMVRDTGERDLLFDLDKVVQSLAGQKGQGDGDVIRLTGLYHNLLRRWADA